jgi:hypothetical protein
MTPARNNLMLRPVLLRAVQRAVLLFLFALLLLWSAPAEAHTFAPMCDESGASAIAPLPVYPRDHGEIRQAPCRLKRPTSSLGKALPEQPEEPKTNIEPAPRHIVMSALPTIEFETSAPERVLFTTQRELRGDDHRGLVYRPPRVLSGYFSR